MSLLRDRNLALVGTASLLLALAVAFVPSVAALLRPLAGLTGTTTVLLFGGVAGLLGLWSFKRGVGDADETELWSPRRLPERAYYDEHRTAGADVDAVLDDEEAGSGPRTNARSRIRETAVSVIANAHNCSNGEANQRLNDGSWTDDPRAAAFFAKPGVSTVPLRARIRDWASGESFERQARYAVAELERIAAEGIESHRGPQHTGLFADDDASAADSDDGEAESGGDPGEVGGDPTEVDDDLGGVGEGSVEPETERLTGLDEEFVEIGHVESNADADSPTEEPPLSPEMRAMQAESSSPNRRADEDGQHEETAPSQLFADDWEGAE